MKSKLSSFVILAATCIFASCGASKELKESQAQAQQLQSDLAGCKTSLAAESTNANSKIADLNGQVASLSALNASLAKDAAKYQQLKSDYQAQRELLNAYLADQGTSLTEIREKLITGLSALLDSGVEVTLKNDLLYLTLPERLLFKEGSATLDKKSSKAFSPVTSVLNNYPKVQIYIVGHTDSLTIHNATFKDNWSLSTERANSIVRIFRDTYKVNPARLMAAGRSKFSPVADNSTKEGRALNRRIQIILNPNLTGLWDEVLQ